MSMDLFLLPRTELSDDAVRDAVNAMCARSPDVSFAGWDATAFGGVVSFWRVGLVSVESARARQEELPRTQAAGSALVISEKAQAWEFVVFVAEHLARELDAVLFDPQQGDVRDFEDVPTYDLEDLRALFDEMNGAPD